MENLSCEKIILDSSQKALASDANSIAFFQLITALFVGYTFLDPSSLDYFSVGPLVVVILLATVRFGSTLFEKKISNKEWMLYFTIQMALTSTAWAVFFIKVALSSQTATSMVPFIFLVPLGLCASSFLSLSVSRAVALVFQVPLQASMLASFFILFQDVNATILGTAGTLIFSMYSFLAQKRFNKNWINLQLYSSELQNIIDAIPGGLSVVQNGNYVKVNSYVTANLLTHEKDLLNRPVGGVYPNSEFTQALMAFADSEMQRLQKEIVIPTTVGPRTHYIIFRKMQSHGQSIIISSFDIEDLKQAQQDLERQNAKLEYSAKMASLGEMSSGLAHEINNPLAVISARAQIMQAQLAANIFDKPQYDKAVETILEMTARIAKIIKSLKLFAKDTSSEVFESASLNEIIEQTMALFEARAITQSAVITKFGLEKSLTLDCLPTQVSQVILNALNNSFDAIQNLSEKWIRLQVLDDGPNFRIEITDSGNGIPAAHKEKVMRPFFTTKGTGSGTGLGLSISKRIVEDHGGRLYFDYDCANTKLVFTLPKKQQLTAKVPLKPAS